ncbi:MAG: hydroxymethylbilane synthase [Acidobacteria bacterium]|nr:MAG: hydroxymethylbilane synthase [Acidobacteriota bacterium]
MRLGTRGSQLALWQARTAAALIEESGGPRCEIVVIRTTGDRLAEAALSEVGGKRLFVKEIEDALLRHEVDFAVHSCKDMPAELPPGLGIAAILPREDPRDAVVLPEGTPGSPESLEDLLHLLGQQPRMGTSSVRRVAELIRLMPGARFLPIRGNLDTRLRKLDAGGYDALVLATAGMRRLGFASRISLALPVDACVPAPGQGAIAIELRAGDERTREAVARVNQPLAAAAVAAERALVAELGGGCQVPIGALALPDGDSLDLQAVVVSLDGQRAVRARARGPGGDAAGLGRRVARQLLEDGAGAILDDVREAQGPAGGLQP